MAREEDQLNITLGPWPKGMNNRAVDSALPKDTCRNAVNVEFDSSGKSRLRLGATKVYAGVATGNGFSCPAGCFMTEAGALKRLNADNTTTTLGALAGQPVGYHYANGVLYLSDGLVSRKVVGGALVSWGLPVPPAPILGQTAGTYGAGTYLGAVTFVDGDSVESGALSLASVTVPADSGIVFYNLPAALDPRVVWVRLYLSVANGAELYHIADVLPGTSSYTISAGLYDDANLLEMLGIIPPPAGGIISSYSARAYVAFDNIVAYSEPFEFEHFRATNTLQFPGTVKIVAPVSTGIFFATDTRTYFYAGQPDPGFQVTEVLPYGAIPGTFKELTDQDAVLWQSQRGLVMGFKDGTAKNVQEDNVAAESGTSGAVLVKNHNGIKQAVAVINNPQASSLAARSFIEAEIIRRS